MSQAKRIDWHRWFGIGLTEHFHGTPWRVELEKELALKRQASRRGHHRTG